MAGEIGEHVEAARGAHQLGDPADAGNHRLVPFLEIDARPDFAPGGGHARVVERALQRRGERVGLADLADQRTERAHHRQDAGNVALVEGVHRHIGADQGGGDVGLQVREGENEVGRKRQDFRNVRRGEGRHARLLAPHPRRAHRIAGDADDAVLLAEEIKRLHGLFGQADDSLGREHAGL